MARNGKGLAKNFYIDFILMRHAEACLRHKTSTTKFVEDEINRKITDLGKTQIQKIYNVDLVITSPARRAWETACLATGIDKSQFQTAKSLSTHLWNGEKEKDWELVEQVFVYPGDKRSLSEAYSSATTEQRCACDLITTNAFWEVIEIIKEQKYHNGYKKVLIVGHALHLQALGMTLAGTYFTPATDTQGVRNIVLGLGETVRITTINL